MTATAGARPILVVVHGTEDGPVRPADFLIELYYSPDEVLEMREGWKRGERWWQADSRLFQRLSERIVDVHGSHLSDPDAVLRFTWSGANLESDRVWAAQDLADSLAGLARDGRSIHVFAHSHGGNVVSRALLRLRRQPEVLSAIRSVTCFGTPFFCYSIVPRVIDFAIALAVTALFILGSSLWTLWGPKTSAAVLSMLGGAGMGLAAIATLRIPGAIGPLRRSFSLHRALRDPPKIAAWRNYVCAKDEAISLLSSFNDDVRFLQTWDDVSLAGIALVVVGFGAAVGLGVYGQGQLHEWLFNLPLVAHSARHGWSWGAVLRWLVNKGSFVALWTPPALFCLAVWKGYMPIRRRLLGAVDHQITLRLRTVAYGDDDGAGIVGVAGYPWPGAEAVMTPAPPEIDQAIETYVADSSQGLWPGLRSRLAGGEPLTSQNLAQVVSDTLTWNELAHTVYGRVDAFIDLLAEDLIATGDWRAAGPAATASEAS